MQGDGISKRYKVWLENVKRPLRRPRRRWNDNIKIMLFIPCIDNFFITINQ
jgi:hypothetical protein